MEVSRGRGPASSPPSDDGKGRTMKNREERPTDWDRGASQRAFDFGDEAERPLLANLRSMVGSPNSDVIWRTTASATSANESVRTRGGRTMRVGHVIVVSFPRYRRRRDLLLDLLQGVQDRGLQFGLSRFVGEAVQAGGGLLSEGADFTKGVHGTGLNLQDRIACRLGQRGDGLG